MADHRELASRIREAILQGQFVSDQRLVEADLCEQFDASRGAVRSALAELTSEGLVVKVANRGARVRAVSVEEAVEITEVRMVIEGLCAAKAAQRAEPADVALLQEIRADLVRSVEQGDLAAYSRANQRLHASVREISGQQTASVVLERLRGQSVRHQFRLAMRPGRPATSLPEHVAIIDAVCAGDAEAAEQAMRAHLRSVIDALRVTADA